MEEGGGCGENVAGEENAAAKMKYATDDKENDGDFLEAASFFEGREHGQVGS